MKKLVLFVYGDGERVHEECRKLVTSPRDAFGTGYDVRSPKVPGEDSPEYGAWRDRIVRELPALDGEVILVGHPPGLRSS